MSIFKPGTIEPSPANPSVPSDSGARTKGIDVYHDDEITSWSRIKDAGYEYVFIKCSEGASYSDPKFLSYVKGAKAAGLLVGAYHFMRYTSSGSSQAKRALSICLAAGLNRSDFSLICDWEDSTLSSTQQMIVKEFLETVKEVSNRTPIIYCSDSVVTEIGAPSWFKSYPLWVARYSNSEPRAKWWSFWQFGESAVVPGMGNKCDVNVFKGSLDELKKFILDH